MNFEHALMTHGKRGLNGAVGQTFSFELKRLSKGKLNRVPFVAFFDNYYEGVKAWYPLYAVAKGLNISLDLHLTSLRVESIIITPDMADQSIQDWWVEAGLMQLVLLYAGIEQKSSNSIIHQLVDNADPRSAVAFPLSTTPFTFIGGGYINLGRLATGSAITEVSILY